MLGTVLVVEKIVTNRLLMRMRLTEAGYRPIFATSAMEAIKASKSAAPDVILADLETIGDDWAAFFDCFRKTPYLAHLPLIVLAHPSAIAGRVRALNAGADDVLDKPIKGEALLARLRRLMRMRQDFEDLGGAQDAMSALGLAESASPFENKGVVAVVGGRPEMFQLRDRLSKALPHRFLMMSAKAARELSEDSKTCPDVFLIDADIESPDDGLRLMAELASRPRTRVSSCVIVDFSKDDHRIGDCLDRGAAGWIKGDLANSEIAARIDRTVLRKRLSDVMRDKVRRGLQMAVCDPLTGLLNRRSGLVRLNNLAKRSVAAPGFFSILLLDIDHFKSINDTLGHLAGDQVLVEVAQRLQRNIGPDDVLIRFGGEEFLIASAHENIDTASKMANQLRVQISSKMIALNNGRPVNLTVSAGVATYATPFPAIGEDLENRITDMIDSADKALLTAKAMGRDRVAQSYSVGKRAQSTAYLVNRPEFIKRAGA